jgi:hypothetical protein
MIPDVDETLQTLLCAELSRSPGCPIFEREQISFDPPAAAEAVQDGVAHINLYLHDLRENLELRDESFRITRSERDGIAGRRRAPVRMDLSYLVTVYAGDNPRLEHRLLSDVLGVMLRCLAVPSEHLRGVLSGLGPNGVGIETAQPDHKAYTDPSALWQALGGRLRPALSLKVTVPFDPFETKWTKMVREAALGLVPGTSDETAGNPATIGNVQLGAVGVVLDRKSETPLRNVEVTAVEHNQSTLTDERGLFVLNLPPGNHQLKIVQRGYEEQLVPVTVPAPGKGEVEPLVIALRGLSDAERAQQEAALVASQSNGTLGQSNPPFTFTSGTVRFADGRPARYLPVRLGGQSTLTDGEGIYRFLSVPAEAQTLLAQVPGRGEVALQMHNGTATIEEVVADEAQAAPESAPKAARGARQREGKSGKTKA